MTQPTNEPEETATPLTDVAEFMWKSIPGCDQRMMVEPEFARALEIQLSQAKEANRLGLAFHLKQTAALESRAILAERERDELREACEKLLAHFRADSDRIEEMVNETDPDDHPRLRASLRGGAASRRDSANELEEILNRTKPAQ